jgi:hypothetical protein
MSNHKEHIEAQRAWPKENYVGQNGRSGGTPILSYLVYFVLFVVIPSLSFESGHRRQLHISSCEAAALRDIAQ